MMTKKLALTVNGPVNDVSIRQPNFHWMIVVLHARTWSVLLDPT